MSCCRQTPCSHHVRLTLSRSDNRQETGLFYFPSDSTNLPTLKDTQKQEENSTTEREEEKKRGHTYPHPAVMRAVLQTVCSPGRVHNETGPPSCC